MNAKPKWIRRAYEDVALVAARQTRELFLFWARQCHKSTTLATIALEEMMQGPGRNVIAASASLLLGSELASKTAGAAAQAVMVTREAAAVQAALLRSGLRREKGIKFLAANSQTGTVYDSLSKNDFVDLYRCGKLEMRLMYDRDSYSRLQVIAPNPATARGWTGTVLQDESGFVRQFRELQAAIAPIIDTDPSFRMIYASNLPADDRHPVFDMTLPPADAALPVNPEGNLYVSQAGITVHRVTLADAYAAGHTLYSKQRKPMSIEDAYAAAVDKRIWKQNYALVHEFGGVAAVDLFSLTCAQKRGIGQCACVWVDNDAAFEVGLAHLRQHLGGGKVGIGWDVATTTSTTSNPNSVTVTERTGVEYCQPLVMLWKEHDPKIARERVRRIIETVATRPQGGRALRLCIDATNERYYAQETSRDFGKLLPVELVVQSVLATAIGDEHPVNLKTRLGDLYAAQINDNHYTLPPERYLADDHRLVIKDRGAYTCDAQPGGMHGDTFDSGKLAQRAAEYVEWDIAAQNKRMKADMEAWGIQPMPPLLLPEDM